MKNKFHIAIFAALFVTTFSLRAEGEPGVYKHLVIRNFEAGSAKEIPPDFLQQLRRNVSNQMVKTNRFQEVTILKESEQLPANADIELSGRITDFKKGNRALRYWTVPGVGATKIKAAVQFKNLSSGKVIFEGDVDGKVIMGAGGGDSLGATMGLAKEIAKVVQKKLP